MNTLIFLENIWQNKFVIRNYIIIDSKIFQIFLIDIILILMKNIADYKNYMCKQSNIFSLSR